MSKRQATNGNENGRLTPQQLTAVDLLVSGRTLTETAEAIGVGRPAVSDWCNHFPPFIAALGARRQELWDGQVETLRGLLPKALAVLGKELDGPQPLPAALAILKSCGLSTGLGRPTGPVTVEEAEQAQRRLEVERSSTALTEADVAHAQRRREQDRMMAELLL